MAAMRQIVAAVEAHTAGRFEQKRMQRRRAGLEEKHQEQERKQAGPGAGAKVVLGRNREGVFAVAIFPPWRPP